MNAREFFVTQSQIISEDMMIALEKQVWLMPNWKWLAIGSAFVLAYLVKPIIHFALKKIKEQLHQHLEDKKNFLAFFLETKVEQPISWILISLIWLGVLDAISPHPTLNKHLTNLTILVLGYFIIKLFYLAVDAFGQVFMNYAKQTDSTMDDMLAPFITKSLKVFVVIVGFLLTIQNMGINVMSILAGLGLGGLALALAAQDTAANLFGSITIFLDQPFKVGDWVKIQDVEGTVEEIGFRSTRIRTFYNSLIAIPNSIVAKEKLDNMGVRPLRRIRHNFGLNYSTPPHKIEEFCEAVRYIIMQDEKVVKDSVTVVFNGYLDSSLNVLVNFHLSVHETPEELSRQQRILLDILAMAAQIDVNFAFPSRTVYLQSSNLNQISHTHPSAHSENK